MHRKILVLLFICFLTGLYVPGKIFAVENPLAQPNNKFGVHILFPSEVSQAAQLVNSKGGDWGYVIIPIQAGDRDVIKWQQFMNDCKQYHVIPIVRLATGIDYFNTTAWRRPDVLDVLDFANFLNSLKWPVKNRYIVVFNEVNRSDEYGGSVDPADYATLLSYTTTIFKAKSKDFFVISAGLDNAANSPPFSLNEYEFLREMNQAVPGIFNQIDGIGSHSYPNPGFAQAPGVMTSESIASFVFEKNMIEGMTTKDLPVFITETGWPTNIISDTTAAAYYRQAFATVWNDRSIVAVAPFLLQAGGGPFTSFSLLRNDNSQTFSYNALATIPKIKGVPLLPPKVLGDEVAKITQYKLEDFSTAKNTAKTQTSNPVKQFLKWFLGL